MRLRVPRKAEGVDARAFQENILVYNARDQALHSLNRTAREIWQLCDGKNTIESIARKIAAKYGLRFEESLDEVSSFIRKAQRKGLVKFG